MLKYILKRLLLIIPVVIGITLFIYLLLDLAPGDPVSMILGTDATKEQVAELKAELGLDKNVLVRYVNFMGKAVQGDLGKSWMTSKPVTDEFMQRLPNTLSLAFSALAITIVIAPDTKGSRSWLPMGPVKIQPAEFAKFAVALALGKLMDKYGFNIKNLKDIGTAIGLIILPMLLIIGQKETGSALVYLAFFLMLYREGMTGSLLFTGFACVVYQRRLYHQHARVHR